MKKLFANRSGAYIRAHGFRQIERDNAVRISCNLESKIFPHKLWFDVKSREPGGLAVDEPNWAAIALLYPAMLSGSDLVIEAEISPRLLHTLSGDLQGLLIAYDSRLKPIQINAGLRRCPKLSEMEWVLVSRPESTVSPRFSYIQDPKFRNPYGSRT